MSRTYYLQVTIPSNANPCADGSHFAQVLENAAYHYEGEVAEMTLQVSEWKRLAENAPFVPCPDYQAGTPHPDCKLCYGMGAIPRRLIEMGVLGLPNGFKKKDGAA